MQIFTKEGIAMQYHLSALEILQILEYMPKKENRQILEELKQKYKIPLPKTYCDFMEYAFYCPLFETSNLWTTPTFPRMFYEDITENIEDIQTNTDEDMDETDPYYPFSQIPQEEWSNLVCDYFLIGSDYGGGSVTFGIRRADLEQDDPPIYWQHEMDEVTYWRDDGQTLSQFLLEVLYNTLSCIEYSTAEDALKENNWQVEEYYDAERDDWSTTITELEKQGIQYQQLQPYRALDGSSIYGCYDPTKNILYVIYQESDEIISIHAIHHMDTENVFQDPFA